MEKIARTASANRTPVPAEMRDTILEPFVAAIRSTLNEMATTEATVDAVYRATINPLPGDLSAVVTLISTSPEALVLSFPVPTASRLARRILPQAIEYIDDSLVRDCVGEIANVVAGQAKAMLADSPFRITCSIPRVVTDADELQPFASRESCIVVFTSSEGEFAMRLFLKRDC